MRSVAIIGCNSTDIIYYLSVMIICGGHSVAVVDHTADNECMYMSSLQGKSGYVGDIFFVSAVCTGKEILNDFDIVFHYFGFDVAQIEFDYFEDAIFVCNMNPFYAAKLCDLVVKDEITRYIIIRDFLPMQFTEDYIRGCTKIDIPKENRYVINFDEFDYRYQCTLSVNRKHNIKKLSTSMRIMLEDYYHRVFPSTTAKDMKMIYRESGRY